MITEVDSRRANVAPRRSTTVTSDELEAELSVLIGEGQMERAATRMIETYGPELYGFLVNVLSTVPDAAEVFSQMSEDLWSGLSEFRQQCSVRTWLYTLARNAAARYLRSPWNASGRRTGTSGLDALVAEARSRTQPWLRSDIKDRWSLLREALDSDDRSLLVLRVDRALPWEDVARIMLGGLEPEATAIKRESERLRKRFQVLKEDLRARAHAAGLLDEDS